jgi:hypothetical protein
MWTVFNLFRTRVNGDFFAKKVMHFRVSKKGDNFCLKLGNCHFKERPCIEGLIKKINLFKFGVDDVQSQHVLSISNKALSTDNV